MNRFDKQVDAWFDAVRGQPVADTAAVALSNLGDYGFVWAVVAGSKWLRRPRNRTRIAAQLAVAGVSSYVTTGAIKRLVDRDRPDEALDVAVRSPSSSSFPSGHTLAAFCTAVVLADRPIERVAYLGFATGVAASRVHVRAHHPSDVIGGAVLGTALGLMITSMRR